MPIANHWIALATGACGLALLAAPAALAQRSSRAAEQQAANEKQYAENTKAWNADPAPADPRDFQGIWQLVGGFDNAFRPITDKPMDRNESIKLVPMTPAEAASREHRLAMTAAGTPVADASADCLPHGMPRIMASSYPIQFDYAPGMISTTSATSIWTASPSRPANP